MLRGELRTSGARFSGKFVMVFPMDAMDIFSPLISPWVEKWIFHGKSVGNFFIGTTDFPLMEFPTELKFFLPEIFETHFERGMFAQSYRAQHFFSSRRQNLCGKRVAPGTIGWSSQRSCQTKRCWPKIDKSPHAVQGPDKKNPELVVKHIV